MDPRSKASPGSWVLWGLHVAVGNESGPPGPLTGGNRRQHSPDSRREENMRPEGEL